MCFVYNCRYIYSSVLLCRIYGWIWSNHSKFAVITGALYIGNRNMCLSLYLAFLSIMIVSHHVAVQQMGCVVICFLCHWLLLIFVCLIFLQGWFRRGEGGSGGGSIKIIFYYYRTSRRSTTFQREAITTWSVYSQSEILSHYSYLWCNNLCW